MTCQCPMCGSVIDEIPVSIFPERGMVVAGGAFTEVTGKEMLLIEALVHAFPKGLSREQIMDKLYGGMDEPEIKIIDVFVFKVRKKISPLGVRIDTLWGNGYALGMQVKPRIIEAAT